MKNVVQLPRKIQEQQCKITTDFLRICAEYLEALFDGKLKKRMTSREFAEKMQIHPRHLTCTIRITTGQTPNEFIEEAIINEAKRLLIETRWPISKIATQFAYEDPANFTKFFKGAAEITPLQFRKTNPMKREPQKTVGTLVY